MKKSIPFILLLFLAGSVQVFGQAEYDKKIDQLAEELANQIKAVDLKTIGVADFSDLQGDITELGKLMAEDFSVALAASGKGFEVVDRSRIEMLIEEHQLGNKGLLDPETTAKLGKVAGIQALITGRITPFGDYVRVTIKILNTERSVVIGASKGNFAQTEALKAMLDTKVKTSGPHQNNGRGPTVIGPNVSSGNLSVKEGDFEISLISWQKRAEILECDIMVKYRGEEPRSVNLSSASSVSIQDGTSFYFTRVLTGNHKANVAYYNLPFGRTGDFIRLKLQVNEMKREVSAISKIQIVFGRKYYTLLPTEK